MKKRTGTVDFFKFIFAIIIVGYHAGSFYNTETNVFWLSGFIGVEFYFIVSGYLLAAKADKNSNTNLLDANLQMLKQKVIHIFPYILLACIASNIFYCVGEKLTIKAFADNSLRTLSDLFGLQMAGFDGFFATGVSWYISALFIVSFIIYPLLCKNRQLFTKYIAPLLALFLLGYMDRVSGTINDPGEWWGIVHKGLLRGFADMSIGCIAYEVKCYIDQAEIKNKFEIGIMEVAGYAITICYAIFHGMADNHDFFLIPLLLLSVSISFSDKSVLGKIFSARIFNTLGVFSLSIYLNHFYVKQNLPEIFPDMERTRMLMLYFGIVLCLACVNYFLGKFLSKFIVDIKGILRILVILFTIIGAVLVVDRISVGISMNEFEGNGTAETPYIIDSKDKLIKMRDLVNRGESFEGEYFIQSENIDLENEEWIPIGEYGTGKYFEGTYDGLCHYVENLTIVNDSEEPQNVGFFGELGGTVRNLGIESGTIEGACVGSLASHAFEDKASVINCYNKAQVHGTVRAGGICDNFASSTIINCVNTGEVSAPIASPILSYTAGTVIGVYPSKDVIPKTFTGEYIEVQYNKGDVRQLLNTGIDQLKTMGQVDTTQIKTW